MPVDPTVVQVLTHAGLGFAGGVVQVVRDKKVNLPEAEDGTIKLHDAEQLITGAIGGALAGALMQSYPVSHAAAFGLGLGLVQVKDVLKSVGGRFFGGK